MMSAFRNPLQELTRTEKRLLLAITLFALALRIGYHVAMDGNVLVQHLQLDEAYHDSWSQSIAAGDFIGKDVFFRAPLYAYLVATLYALFGHHPDLVRLLQHILGAGLVTLTYILSRFLLGKRAAVVASILCATYAVLISFEGRLLFDSLLTFMVFLWLTLAIIGSERDSWKWYALLGFLFGLICTLRPTFIAIAPFALGYMSWVYLRNHTTRVRCLASFVAAFLIPILIVTVRNALVGGDFILIASQGGINFYIGNNPQSDGMSSVVPDVGEVWGQNREVEYIAEKAVGHQLRPSEVSSYWYNRGWEFIRSHPLESTQLFLKKFYLFWSRIEIENNLSFYWFERASALLRLLPVGFWLVGPLGIAGAVLAWNIPRSRMLLVVLIQYVLVTIAFFVADRFRLPVVPILCVFAGLEVQQASFALASRNLRTLSKIVIGVVMGVLLVDTNLANLQPDTRLGEEELEGQVALESGDFVKAAKLLGRAADVDPQNSSLRINQGSALWRTGDMLGAEMAFRAALAGNPYVASLNLSHLYFTLQQLDSSLSYAHGAIRARPFGPGGYVIAAKILLVRRQDAEAERILLAGNAACGEEFVYGDYLLGGIDVAGARLALADSIYRSVLARTSRPQQPEYSIGSEKELYGEDLATLRAKSFHALGRVLAARGQLDSSEVYFRTASRLLPMRLDILADWGVCLLKLGRLDEAERAMEQIVGIDPRNPAMWLNYATVLARKGKYPEARRATEEALRLKPEFQEAQLLLRNLATVAKGNPNDH